jgi:hypothetical protein
MVENVDIFEEIVEEEIPEKTSKEIRDQRKDKILHNLEKLLIGTADWTVGEASMPAGWAVQLLNWGSKIMNGPEVPNPVDLNNFIGALAENEYQGGPKEKLAWWLGGWATNLITGGVAYDLALNKIRAAYPKLYTNLIKMFPYSVGQIHGIHLDALRNTKDAITKGKKGLGPRVARIAKDFYNRSIPTWGTWKHIARNTGNLLKVGGGALGVALPTLMTKPAGGDIYGEGPLDDFERAIKREAMKALGVDHTQLVYQDYKGTELESVNLSPRHMMDEKTAGEYLKKHGVFPSPFIIDDEVINKVYFGDQERPSTQEELDQKHSEYYKEDLRKQSLNPSEARMEFWDEWGQDWKDWMAETKLGKGAKWIKENEHLLGNVVRSFIDPGGDEEVEVYDMFSQTIEGQAEDQADKAENEQLRQDMLKVNTLPSYEELYGKEGKVPPVEMGFGGDPNDLSSGIAGDNPYFNLKELDLDESEFEPIEGLDIFEEAKKEGYEEVQMAENLLGKVPMWAVANVDKAKMLLQIFTKNEKKNLDNVKNKLGTKDEVTKTVEDIDIIDTPSGATTVGTVKTQKTIIDSPEDAEKVFYSGLEARLMDPNTPKSFNSADDFFDFINRKGVGKAEIEDNILNHYIQISQKNKTPLLTDDMLKIVRQSPMRKIESTTYGTKRYGGDKSPKYPGYQESGALPGSYREEVLFLDPKYLPNDPDKLPGSAHDFTERYVIGWTRKTDRQATIPVDKTKLGVVDAIDEKQMRVITKNQKKLDKQINGLYASAYSKLKRQFAAAFTDDIDDLTTQQMRSKVNRFSDDLKELDQPLMTQIAQFENKFNADQLKLNKYIEVTEGQKVIVTMADEIQSDILQQAKKLENDLREQLGEILDLPKEKRMQELFKQRTSYTGKAKEVEPEVLQFYTQNESIFRPMFHTAEDMQKFVDDFNMNKLVFEEIAKAGPSPDPALLKKAQMAAAKETKMLEELEVALSENAMKQLFPNVPFKNRMEWGSALVKNDLANAANLLYGPDKIPDAATWYAISPAKFIKKRYTQKGGTDTPLDQRSADTKGVGTEEFYGGPDSVSTTIDKSGTAATNPNYGKPKHYTSTLEKILRTLAKENNSEFKVIKVDGMGEVYSIKITPEMLLPHKTHRKDGGMVYTPELINIFEAA